MADNIWTLIRKRFPATEFALLQEVRDAAGFQASRSADGIAMNLWPSRGLEIEGIELKSYRGDWLNELRKPHKAEAIFKYCDRFWLVAANDAVVKEEEVPKTWGLLVSNGKCLKQVIAAPKLEPQGLDKHFVAAMLKRATSGLIHPDTISDRIKEAEERGKTTRDYEASNNKEELRLLREKVAAFELASGVTLGVSRYSFDKAEEIGAAVKLILDGGVEDFVRRLDQLEKASEHIHSNIKKTITGLKPEPINNENITSNS